MDRRRTVLLSASCTTLLMATLASAQEAAAPWSGVAARESDTYDGAATQGHARTWKEAISRDGRLVVFDSSDPNIVPDDTNHVTDVFVRDRSTGLASRVSVNPGFDTASSTST